MKKFFIKWSIVLAVFLAALFTISSMMNKGNTDLTVEMSEATYPVVTLLYEDSEINTLYGYAEAMEVNYMRGAITPLMGERKTSFQIEPFGNTITGVHFEVRSIDGQRLIEATQVDDLREEAGKVIVDITLKDLIDSGKEYVLILMVSTEEKEDIRYYTRVIYGENLYTKEKLDFVLDFSERTLDKERAKELTRYLESNSEGDNTTLGKVDIHSSFQQVTFGELSMERMTLPEVRLLELTAQTGSFVLTYTAYDKDSDGTNYYRVEEYYRVRYTADRMYLLDYERTMNRIFDEKKDIYGSRSIALGITGEEVPLMESDGGSVFAFVTQGRLHSYNLADNKLAFLFGFYNEENHDQRDLHDEHEVRILNIDEGGNVTFLVCGYMNRGRHEGSCGISVYYYDSTVNTTEELLYVPSRKSPGLLIAEADRITYINRAETLYLMLDNELYGINALSRSCEVVATDLKEGCYQVSESNQMVVWQKEKELYEGTELVLMNLNTGRQTSVKAGAAESIAPLGFIGDDLIYGIAKKRDIVIDDTGNTIFPMYVIRIMNESDGVVKEYQQDEIYVTEGIVAQNQITLQRVEKKEDGSYAEIEDDQIMNSQIASESSNYLEKKAVEHYQTITQIALKEEIDETTLKLLTPKEVLFEGGRNIGLAESDSISKRYYVYGKKGVEGIFMDEGNAVSLAENSAGVVVDDLGTYIWIKGNRSLKNQIMAIEGASMQEEQSSLAVCLDTMLTYEGISRDSQYLLDRGESVTKILQDNLENCQVLDLTGCTLDSMLYYVNQDIPVLVMLQDRSAVLLIGYNEQNTVLMNPETGTVYKWGMNDSKEWFEQNGNKFVTYVRNGK